MNNKEQLEVTMVIGDFVSTLSANTIRRIESDLQKFKDKYLLNHSENDFNHLFSNPDLVQQLPDDLKDEFNNITSIRNIAKQNIVTLNRKLSVLIVKATIAFPSQIDALTAFFACLPDYFNSESFLKSIKNGLDDEVFSEDDIYQITTQSFVRTSQWVAENTVNQEIEEALMFFVGAQLINDIF